MTRSKCTPIVPFIWLFAILISSCAAPATPTGASATSLPIARTPLRVIAVETFLADIAQKVAGERAQVQALMPVGLDPHAFELTPGDLKRVGESQVLIVNGAGFEEFLDKLLANAGGTRLVIEASAGLTSRDKKPGEPAGEHAGPPAAHEQGDPHFWFDPTLAIKYVENIRDGLARVDPEGAASYRTNADAYIAQLKALDEKIKRQVSVIPPEKRKLVTDHDTFGYFADRYGFEIVGMLVPSFSTADAATAKQLADLIDRIKATGAKAIFLEQGANPQVAEQIARETGVKVVTGLYTHSVSEPGGPAPTYLRMIEYDVATMVDALK